MKKFSRGDIYTGLGKQHGTSAIITRLPDWKVMRAHYGNLGEGTMNITICSMFCFMLICDTWRHCIKANKLHSM